MIQARIRSAPGGDGVAGEGIPERIRLRAVASPLALKKQRPPERSRSQGGGEAEPFPGAIGLRLFLVCEHRLEVTAGLHAAA
jgi:hypothetical protein